MKSGLVPLNEILFGICDIQLKSVPWRKEKIYLLVILNQFRFQNFVFKYDKKDSECSIRFKNCGNQNYVCFSLPQLLFSFTIMTVFKLFFSKGSWNINFNHSISGFQFIENLKESFGLSTYCRPKHMR